MTWTPEFNSRAGSTSGTAAYQPTNQTLSRSARISELRLPSLRLLANGTRWFSGGAPCFGAPPSSEPQPLAPTRTDPATVHPWLVHAAAGALLRYHTEGWAKGLQKADVCTGHCTVTSITPDHPRPQQSSTRLGAGACPTTQGRLFPLVLKISCAPPPPPPSYTTTWLIINAFSL